MSYPPQPSAPAPGAPPVPGAAPGPVPGAAPPAGPPPGGGYSSPIPIVRTHLGHAFASEWTKIRSVRSTMWTLGVMLLLVVGVGFLIALAMSSDDWVGAPLLSGGLFGLMLGQICIVTLGVLVITSEYGTGMIRTTLTASPQRWRVLAAKAVVFFVLAFVLTTAACAITALVHSAVLGGQTVPEYELDSSTFKDSVSDSGELIATGSQWFDATVGAALYVSLLGLLALAVGAILRHSAGAITTMVGFILLPLIIALFMQAESLREVQRKLIEYSPLSGLASLFGIPFFDDASVGGWGLLGLLAAVTGGMLLLAFALLSKRDV
ncbi:ABC transporter permease [Streptomyces sp. CMB-StM0423]|uniref:ABC transporter permease n=1 Tax=Streptomyces sp. CMB-StM0423 TaxID=2059884 RepID=UPI000C6FD1C4|nr:ABC transporter permease [Streptomyces sp. CMB-StM0423]AUH40425.1 ABC transporter permease [Streptomyces sp. CMB-StM0423]